MVKHVLVKYDDQEVGVIMDSGSGAPQFEYFPEFIQTGIQLSPIHMPLPAMGQRKIFRFPELIQSEGYQDTFKQLPGLLADALPEKFGNQLLAAMLARKGSSIEDLTSVERLSYLGKRGMGALEFEPDVPGFEVDSSKMIDVIELVDVARQVLEEHNGKQTSLSEDKLQSIIAVGTSAGGAKAKAIIAWNRETNEVRSGQVNAPEGFEHWLIKFDEFENDEHAFSNEIGRVEYAYYKMAIDAGIEMTESRLFEAGGLAHFMTRRFDRPDSASKLHVQSFSALAHADRNPPGLYGYESMFRTAKQLRCGQNELNEMFRRMAFNIISRNQDDHTKNHAFTMSKEGEWAVSPAYDLCFSYKPGSRYIGSHQMRCNDKRDNFELADLLAAAKSADVKEPVALAIIEQVSAAIKQWPDHAQAAGLSETRMDAINNTFRDIKPESKIIKNSTLSI